MCVCVIICAYIYIYMCVCVCVCPSNASLGSRNATENRCLRGRFWVNQRMLWNAMSQKKKLTKKNTPNSVTEMADAELCLRSCAPSGFGISRSEVKFQW